MPLFTQMDRKPKPLRDEELVRIVQEFRYRLRQHGVSTMGVMPLASLMVTLEMHGVESEVMISNLGGGDHFWLKLADGRALDPFPPLYFGPPTEYHLRSEPSLATGERFDPLTGEIYEPSK